MENDKHIIFQAEYSGEGKKISVKINSSFNPMLTYALKLLEIEIEKRLVEENIKSEIENAPVIQKPELNILLNRKG